MQAPSNIDTPSLLVDMDVLEANIANVQAIADRHGVRLRPHVKTHKTPLLAHKQLAAGAVGITCAKLTEAEVFAQAGIGDIFIANEIIRPRKVERLLRLARYVNLTVGVDSVESAQPLSDAANAVGQTLRVRIEVDTGLGRCGVPPGEAAVRLAEQIAAMPGLVLDGLFIHEGHAGRAETRDELERIALQAGRDAVETAEAIRRAGIPCESVSVGSSPCKDVTPTVPGVTEMRPGTYIFNDAMQIAARAATEAECALTVLCTVVSRPTRDRVIVDAGSKTMAGDAAAKLGFGRVVARPDVEFRYANEEHGFLRVPEDCDLGVGDRLRIIPTHVCTCVNLHDELVLVRGGEIEATVPIAARGKVK